MSVFDRLFGRARRVTEDSATVELSVPRGPALLAGNVQGVGARERQEDSFAICNISDPDALARQGLFAVVADGMGGMDSGNEASEAAVDSMVRLFRGLLEEGDVPQLKERGVVSNGKSTVEEIFEDRKRLYEKYADITIVQEGRDIRMIVEDMYKKLTKLI